MNVIMGAVLEAAGLAPVTAAPPQESWVPAEALGELRGRLRGFKPGGSIELAAVGGEGAAAKHYEPGPFIKEVRRRFKEADGYPLPEQSALRGLWSCSLDADSQEFD